MIARHIGRRNDTVDFHEFSKLFRRAFESNLCGTHARLKIRNTEHFSGDAKEQIVFPLNVLSGMGKGKAECAHPVEV